MTHIYATAPSPHKLCSVRQMLSVQRFPSGLGLRITVLLIVLPLITRAHDLNPGTTSSIQEAGSLQPGLHRFWQSVRLDTQVNKYLLEGLVPGHSYEVRVSHPAYIPAHIDIGLQGDNSEFTALPLVSSGRSTSRKLLDCDKRILHVSSGGTIQGLTPPIHALVSATQRSVHRDGATGGPTHLVYNIVLQPLLGSVIPTDTLPAILVCTGLLLLLWRLLPWWSSTAAPNLARFISQG